MDRHNAVYGSQSRHVSDMSDINANYFVLFGGQDGAINSESSLNQVPLWQELKYIQTPLEIAKLNDLFTAGVINY
ncbi:MAG: penicillin acylase family protein [Pseudomonadota bacterium]